MKCSWTIAMALLAASPLVAQDTPQQQAPDLDALLRQVDAERARQEQAEAERRRASEAAARQRREAQAEAARQGTLIVRADADCALRVNTQDKGRLSANQSVTVQVNPGQQLIECDAGDGRLAEQVETVPSGEQRVVRLTVPPPPRFMAVSDGVADHQQNLIWASRDNGSDINWHNARNYCANKGSGWSLPTVAQLQSLYDESGRYARRWTNPNSGNSYDIKFATPLIQWTSCCFWSSESKGSSEAFVVLLARGNRDSDPVSAANVYRALCVRRRS